MNEDLVSYLDSICPSLRSYLDKDRDLAIETVWHLYRYSLALLEGLIVPAHIKEDWEDFFDLADAFVLAYGSRRLDVLNKRSALLALGGEKAPSNLCDTDRMFLVALVRALSDFVSARQSTTQGTPQ